MTVGIDVWEGNDPTPVWDLAKDHGNLRFVIARAMENTTPDAKYKSYVQQCLAHGIPCSPYLMLRFGSEAHGYTPEAQVKACLAFTGPLNHRYMPFAIDLEFPHGRAATGLTALQALDWLRRAWQTAKDLTGVAPIIYTSKTVWVDPDGMNDLQAPWIAESLLWPKYWPWPVGTPAVYEPSVVDRLGDPAIPPPWGSQWGIDQYMGDAPNYPGFTTVVDMNRMRLIQQGATGDTVKWIQRRVGAKPDGIYGPDTKNRVMVFQQSHGLQVDGIVGYDTTSVLAWHNPS